MVQIMEIYSPEEKSTICEKTLRALPEWFGNRAAIVDYTAQVRDMPFYTALIHGQEAGFVAVKKHNEYTAEVCVMGVRKEFHRQGIGRMLIERTIELCRERGIEFVTVKTLDASREDAGYANTRRFYYSMGFRPLEVFPKHWDEANPCLFMAMYLGE